MQSRRTGRCWVDRAACSVHYADTFVQAPTSSLEALSADHFTPCLHQTVGEITGPRINVLPDWYFQHAWRCDGSKGSQQDSPHHRRHHHIQTAMAYPLVWHSNCSFRCIFRCSDSSMHLQQLQHSAWGYQLRLLALKRGRTLSRQCHCGEVSMRVVLMSTMVAQHGAIFRTGLA